VDAVSGEVVWKYETESYINGTPAVADGKVAFGGCDARVYVISAQDGKKLNEIDAGSYIAGSAAFDGVRVYLGHYGNEFICADTNTTEILWRREGGDPFFSTPAVSGIAVNPAWGWEDDAFGSAPPPGDLTGPAGRSDCEVNLLDLSVLQTQYLDDSLVNPSADFSGPANTPDGTVNLYDFAWFAVRYLDSSL
jgi:hypothetical protein